MFDRELAAEREIALGMELRMDFGDRAKVGHAGTPHVERADGVDSRAEWELYRAWCRDAEFEADGHRS